MSQRLLGHVKSGQIPDQSILVVHLSDEVLALITGGGLTIADVLEGENITVTDNGDGTLTIATTADISADSVTVDTVSHQTDYVPVGTESIGTRYWDSTNLTTVLVLPNEGMLQDGQELYVRAVNLSGSDVPDGRAVSVVSATGNRIAFDLTDCTDPISAHAYIGLTTESILSGELGRITVTGEVHGLNTDHLLEGYPVYIDAANPGRLVAVKPDPPAVQVIVGVVSVQQLNNGVITIPARIVVPRLSWLSDVEESGFTTSGQVIVWNNTTQTFQSGMMSNIIGNIDGGYYV